jgi:hypothetical protein
MARSLLHLAGLKHTDGLGELPGLPRAAAELTQDAPGLSWALARSPGPRSVAWARLAAFWEAGLFLPVQGGADVITGAGVTLICDHDQPAGGQFVHGSGDPHNLAVWAGDHRQVHPVPVMLTGVEQPVGSHPVDVH